MVFLVGNNPVNNHICVAFSSTNDPLDDWNVYMLVGDALDTNHWTDYPAISITDDDLFITEIYYFIMLAGKKVFTNP